MRRCLVLVWFSVCVSCLYPQVFFSSRLVCVFSLILFTCLQLIRLLCITRVLCHYVRIISVCSTLHTSTQTSLSKNLQFVSEPESPEDPVSHELFNLSPWLFSLIPSVPATAAGHLTTLGWRGPPAMPPELLHLGDPLGLCCWKSLSTQTCSFTYCGGILLKVAFKPACKH